MSAPFRPRRSMRCPLAALTLAALPLALGTAPLRAQPAAPSADPAGLRLGPPASMPWRDLHLRDQFDRRHAVVSPHRATLLLLAERHGSAVLRGWATALATFRPDPRPTDPASPRPPADERPAARVPQAILHVGPVPPLFRRVVRRMLPQDTTETVLVDWQGDVVPTLRRLLNSQAPALAVLIDPTGQLVGWLPLDSAQPATAQVAAVWYAVAAHSPPPS